MTFVRKGLIGILSISLLFSCEALADDNSAQEYPYIILVDQESDFALTLDEDHYSAEYSTEDYAVYLYKEGEEVHVDADSESGYEIQVISTKADYDETAGKTGDISFAMPAVDLEIMFAEVAYETSESAEAVSAEEETELAVEESSEQSSEESTVQEVTESDTEYREEAAKTSGEASVQTSSEGNSDWTMVTSDGEDSYAEPSAKLSAVVKVSSASDFDINAVNLGYDPETYLFTAVNAPVIDFSQKGVYSVIYSVTRKDALEDAEVQYLKVLVYVEDPEEEGTEAVSETAAEESTEAVSETAAEESTEAVSETAAEESTEAVSETAAEESTEAVSEAGAEEETELPAEERPIYENGTITVVSEQDIYEIQINYTDGSSAVLQEGSKTATQVIGEISIPEVEQGQVTAAVYVDGKPAGEDDGLIFNGYIESTGMYYIDLYNYLDLSDHYYEIVIRLAE